MTHLLNEAAAGVYAISVTPFTEGGEIDERSLDTLIAFYLQHGVHGLTVLGMMGEAQALTTAESKSVAVAALAAVAGAVPVVVGVSGHLIATMRDLALTVMEAGAAGVMVAPIAGLQTDQQVADYYGEVFTTLGAAVPVVLQDYPQATGVRVSVDLFVDLVRAYPQLKMLKHEECPGLSKITGIRAASSAQGIRRISILVGNGGLYYPLELRRGADGAMTGFAYPRMLVDVYERFAAGDPDGAEDVYDAYLPLVRYEQQPGIGLAIRKELLRRQGAIRTSVRRLPGPSLTADDLDELNRLVTRLERRHDPCS